MEQVIFSDKSQLKLFDTNRLKQVWRLSNKRHNIDCLIPSVKHLAAVIIWGCFARNRIGLLVVLENSVTGSTYLKFIEEHLLPFMEKLGRETPWIF